METGWANGSPALGAPFGATFLDFPRSEVALPPLLPGGRRGHGEHRADSQRVLFRRLPAGRLVRPGRAAPRTARGVAAGGGRRDRLLLAAIPLPPARAPAPRRTMRRCRLPSGSCSAWQANGRRSSSGAGSARRRRSCGWRIALVAATSIYYAFFAVVLVAACGRRSRRSLRGRARPAASALLVIACIGAALAIALTPALRYRAAEGRTRPSPRARSPRAISIRYARFTCCCRPTATGRRRCRRFARTYNASAPFINENQYRRARRDRRARVRAPPASPADRQSRAAREPAHWRRSHAPTSWPCCSAVTGGLGALLALLVTPQFRALNRISVFIAFFSIAAVVAAIDRAVGRLGPMRAA